MSALAGRNITIAQDSGNGPTTVAGARAKTITFGAEPIDITSDDDSGFRTLLLTDVAQRQLDISLEGVLKDAEIIAAAQSGGGIVSGTYTVNIPGIGAITGVFAFSDVELGAPYNDAVTFSCTMRSSGEFSVAPATT
jgi:TP901-1 family phage major tail protein